jgi:hypothetical protein
MGATYREWAGWGSIRAAIYDDLVDAVRLTFMAAIETTKLSSNWIY